LYFTFSFKIWVFNHTIDKKVVGVFVRFVPSFKCLILERNLSHLLMIHILLFLLFSLFLFSVSMFHYLYYYFKFVIYFTFKYKIYNISIFTRKNKHYHVQLLFFEFQDIYSLLFFYYSIEYKV
jgi:hypothetical protein